MHVSTCTQIKHRRKKVLEEIQRPLNTRSTTVQWLNRQTVDVAEQRLWDIMVHNIAAYKRLIEYVGSLPAELRMVRLGSDVLPVYTQRDWSYYWQRPDVIAYAEREFAKVGDTARALDVRLSMHPGQFTVLASDNADIVDRSIEEFEYHTDVIRYMGYGKHSKTLSAMYTYQAAMVQPVSMPPSKTYRQKRETLSQSKTTKTSGASNTASNLQTTCALVLDVHHHWCREGEYIQPTDDRYKRIVDSWRGVRPAMHYSYSRTERLPEGYAHNTMPNMPALLEAGYKKGKLRAHSDYYPNQLVNDWALSFLALYRYYVRKQMQELSKHRTV